MRFANIQTEWRVRDVESKVNQITSRLYELDSLRSRMASLEHSNGQLSTAFDGLCSQLEEITKRIEKLEENEQ